nr:sigma-70 family RNA polymerase sigma factor [Corallococcus exiguus]
MSAFRAPVRFLQKPFPALPKSLGHRPPARLPPLLSAHPGEVPPDAGGLRRSGGRRAGDLHPDVEDGAPGEGRRHATAWIYRTSTNLAVDRLRQRRSTPPRSSGELMDERSAEATLRRRQELEAYARHLPADALEAALMNRLDGLTQQEIAEVLQVSERTVRRLLQRLDAQVEHLRRTLGP